VGKTQRLAFLQAPQQRPGLDPGCRGNGGVPMSPASHPDVRHPSAGCTVALVEPSVLVIERIVAV